MENRLYIRKNKRPEFKTGLTAPSGIFLEKYGSYLLLVILLGIWGSAFSIILDTLNSKDKKTEAQRQDEIGTRFD